MRHGETEKVGSNVNSASRQCGNDGLTVYYDGSCPLCTAEIGHYGSRTGAGRLNFVDVSGVEVVLGKDLSPEQAMSRFHVRLPDRRLLSGARAFVAIWTTLPGWRWAARVARLPGMITLLEGSYRLFLPARPALSKLAARLGAKPARTRSDV